MDLQGGGTGAPSLTCPSNPAWGATPQGFMRYERGRVVGHGDVFWREASRALLQWEVKTRSGFRVDPPGRVVVGARPRILVGAFGLTVTEPVEVVDVVETPTRVGFAYRTLPGHPVRGEEAFILHRDGVGPEAAVTLTLRSLTRASARRGWRLAFPALLVAQAAVRSRYLRALVG